ncbi:unnamed protein product [Musa hybrid cultivar]
MESSNLQRRYIDFTSTLFREGFLDSQYTQLQQLQDESNPDFVTEVVTLFFQDSEKLQDELSRTLDQEVVDFKKVAAHVHQLKGSSASIGAQRVKNVCMAFRISCEEMNREGSACDLSKYMILVLVATEFTVGLALLQVPQMSAASAAGVFPGEEQAGDSVPAGAADRGRRWIHPNNVVAVLAKPGVVDRARRRKSWRSCLVEASSVALPRNQLPGEVMRRLSVEGR